MQVTRRWRTAWFLAAAVLPVALLLCWEFRFLLVRPGMTRPEVEAILGTHHYVDVLPDVPPEQGHGTFYYEGILRPHLVVMWGPDGKVRKVSY
jgi:hypothetical protein